MLTVTSTLQRTDVPALLELLGVVCGPQLEQPVGSLQQAGHVVSLGAVTPGLLRMLVLGSWCTQPPQVFRRNQLVQQLCTHFGSECEDVLAAVKGRELCSRAVGYNRHGHSAGMPFPGPDGWTEEYEAARRAAVAGKKPVERYKVGRTLQAMKRFTEMAAWARQAAAGDAEKAAAVSAVLAAEPDPHEYDRVWRKLQHIMLD